MKKLPLNISSLVLTMLLTFFVANSYAQPKVKDSIPKEKYDTVVTGRTYIIQLDSLQYTNLQKWFTQIPVTISGSNYIYNLVNNSEKNVFSYPTYGLKPTKIKTQTPSVNKK